MAILNRKWSYTIGATATGATITFDPAPGTAGTPGPGIIVIDCIRGHVVCSTTNATAGLTLTATDSTSDKWQRRQPVDTVTSRATPIDIDFNGNGPKLEDGAVLVLGTINGAGFSNWALGISYHYEP